MIPLVIIRPQPGCNATLNAALARKLDAHCFPLFSVRAVDWPAPDAHDVDALLIGSANALRHGGDGLALYRGKPVYAVGKATAEAATAAGLAVVSTGDGGLQSLLEKVDPRHARLLRLSGEVRVKLTPPEGMTIIERIVYAISRQPIPPALRELLRAPAVVMLHSAEAALHFSAICDREFVDRSQILLAAIGPRVAEMVGSGWRAVAAAPRPEDAALLALAEEMCQT